MENYKGFDIDNKNQIFKNGKRVFTTHHQFNETIDHAKAMIDSSIEMTNYQQYQAERFPNVLPEPTILPDGEVESGIEEMERFSEWMNNHAEKQLYEQEIHF